MWNLSLDNQNILKKHIDFSLSTNHKSAFFIITWQKGVWKSESTQSIAKEILWEFFKNDFLYIKDFSDALQKKHNIKVEQKKDEITSILQNQYFYQDLWTREINRWLQSSPAGNIKIVLIENIERMTTEASNAFLKTCEEPLPNRIIIATTANPSQLMATIISRALIISFSTGTLVFDSNLSIELTETIKLLSSNENIHKKHLALLDIQKKWVIQNFLDQLISNYIKSNDLYNAQKRLKVKKMSQRNVSIDNLLFYWLLD